MDFLGICPWCFICECVTFFLFFSFLLERDALTCYKKNIYCLYKYLFLLSVLFILILLVDSAYQSAILIDLSACLISYCYLKAITNPFPLAFAVFNLIYFSLLLLISMYCIHTFVWFKYLITILLIVFGIKYCILNVCMCVCVFMLREKKKKMHRNNK